MTDKTTQGFEERLNEILVEFAQTVLVIASVPRVTGDVLDPTKAILDLIEFEVINEDQEHSSYCNENQPRLGWCVCEAEKRNELRAEQRSKLRGEE